MLNDYADAADAIRRFFLLRHDHAIRDRQNRRAFGCGDIQARVHAVVEARIAGRAVAALGVSEERVGFGTYGVFRINRH